MTHAAQCVGNTPAMQLFYDPKANTSQEHKQPSKRHSDEATRSFTAEHAWSHTEYKISSRESRRGSVHGRFIWQVHHDGSTAQMRAHIWDSGATQWQPDGMGYC